MSVFPYFTNHQESVNGLCINSGVRHSVQHCMRGVEISIQRVYVYGLIYCKLKLLLLLKQTGLVTRDICSFLTFGWF